MGKGWGQQCIVQCGQCGQGCWHTLARLMGRSSILCNWQHIAPLTLVPCATQVPDTLAPELSAQMPLLQRLVDNVALLDVVPAFP